MLDNERLANPPPFDDILAIFAAEDLRHYGDDPINLTHKYYNYYAAYGAHFRPRSILEIGVRRGYSAFSLIKGAGGAVQRFVGLDFQDEGPHINPTSLDLLSRLGVARLEIRDVDTQLGFPSLEDGFSLVHVDADHSTRGALTDLANALPLLEPGGVIVVDDFDYPPVAAAVTAFLEVLGPAAAHLRVRNYRGHMLIQPTAAAPLAAALFARLPPWTVRLLEIEDLAMAARLLSAAADRPFATRSLVAVAAQVLRLLGEGLGVPAPGGALPGGSLRGLQALIDRASLIACLVAARSDADFWRGPLSALRDHVLYAVERAELSVPVAFTGTVDLTARRDSPDGATTRALFREFSVHAVNFAAIIAAPLLRPPLPS